MGVKAFGPSGYDRGGGLESGMVAPGTAVEVRARRVYRRAT